MFKIHFLNTIWSDCILLENDNHYALVDTGSSYYYEDIKRYLKDNKITTLDFILLTHFHCDHYDNLGNTLDDFTVNSVYFRDYSGVENYTVEGLTVQQYNQQEINTANALKNKIIQKSNLVILDDSIRAIDFNGQIIDIYSNSLDMDDAFHNKLSPYYQQIAFDENENSIGAFIKYHNHTVLLAGDLSNTDYGYEPISKRASKGIDYIYNKYSINSVEIYKAAHHGHQYNNPLEIFAKLKPSYVIVTNTDRFLNNWNTIPNIKSVNENATILKTDYSIHVLDISKEKTEIESIPVTSRFILENRD